MDAFAAAVAFVGGVCLGLPETYEEEAWVGTRWKVGANTFAHVLEIVNGFPRSFATSAGTDGPAVVLTFRSGGHELDQLLTGPAFFGPLWGRTDVGVRLDLHADRAELAELLTESYRLRAPKTLAHRMAP